MCMVPLSILHYEMFKPCYLGDVRFHVSPFESLVVQSYPSCKFFL
jgi:hypothetical protein